MTAKQIYGETMKTPIGRVIFPSVFDPIQNQQGKSIYELQLLFPKDRPQDLKPLQTEVRRIVNAKWGEGVQGVKSPFKDGDKPNSLGNVYDCNKGMVIIRAWTLADNKSGTFLVNHKNQAIIDRSEFYPGCFAWITLTPCTYENSGNRGVTFFLNNVQKLPAWYVEKVWGCPVDDTRLGGSTSATDDFSIIEDGGIEHENVVSSPDDDWLNGADSDEIPY